MVTSENLQQTFPVAVPYFSLPPRKVFQHAVQDKTEIKALVIEAFENVHNFSIEAQHRQLECRAKYYKEKGISFPEVPPLAELKEKNDVAELKGPPLRRTIQQVFALAKELRDMHKVHNKVMDQYRNESFNAKVASRCIENARKNMEDVEERFQAFCKAVANGSIVIDRE